MSLDKSAPSRNPATAIRLYLSRPHRTVGAVILRVTLGLNIMLMYALHFRQRAFIWGDHGVIPRGFSEEFLQVRHSFSIFNLGTSESLHASMFFIGMVVTALFTIGFHTRLMSVLFFVFTFSVYSRNEIVLDGGDNLLILIAFLLMFVDLSGKHVPNSETRPRNVEHPICNPFLALLHNIAIIAIVVQICILYFTSAWAKMMGHMWQDGTAIYYILRTSEFNLSPVTPWLYQNGLIVAALTYSTILLQVGFAFIVWHPKLKYPWILGAFSFHLAIAYFMGLVWFSFTLISCEAIMIGDAAYLAVYRRIRIGTTELRAALVHRSARAVRHSGVVR